MEENAGADTETVIGEGVKIDRGSSGGQVQFSVNVKAVGADVIYRVIEEIADAADIHIPVGIDRGLQVDAQG